ncbi:MAG TPA: preprotein translocase subunit SecG [Gemmatimonadaceae bacterium]|jgi:preprotein translocase subunit SecG|nr:preprotein translocase subunit SecG [Gemmatimonadaceae bacterium]
MVYTILLVLLILDAIVLLAAILLQAGQGGGLAATFGGVSSSADSILGTRQAGNLLTKASWWAGGIFLALSFILSLASTHAGTPKSVLDQTFSNPPAAPAPVNAGGTNAAPLQTAPAPNAQQAPASQPAAPTTKKP